MLLSTRQLTLCGCVMEGWIPPEPGSRGPIVNVPITLLQHFNKEAEQCLEDDRSLREEFQPAKHLDGQLNENHTSASQGDSEDADSAITGHVTWPSSPLIHLRRSNCRPTAAAPRSQLETLSDSPKKIVLLSSL